MQRSSPVDIWSMVWHRMHRTLAVGVAKCAECCRRCCGSITCGSNASSLRDLRLFSYVERALIHSGMRVLVINFGASLSRARIAAHWHWKVSSAAVGARWQWVIHRFDSPLMQTQHDFAGFVPEPDFLRVAAHLRAEQSLAVPRPHLSLLITGGDNQIIAVPVPR